MKKTILALMVAGFVLIGVNPNATAEDLIVLDNESIKLGTGQNASIKYNSGTTALNIDLTGVANTDFHIISSGDADIFHIDGSQGNIGIGTNTPRSNARLDTQGSFSDSNWNTTVLNAEGTQTYRGALWGITAKVNAQPSATVGYTNYRGSSNVVYYSPPGGTLTFTNASPLTGTYSQVQFETGGGTHTFNNAVGLSGSFSTRDNNKGTVNITNAIAVSAGGISSQNTGGGATNITNFKGIAVANPGFKTYSKVSIVNLYGLSIASQTKGANNTNFLIGTGTTGNWSIYNNSTYNNYFAGNVGIGTDTPASLLHVAGDVTVDGNIGAKYQDVAEWVMSSETLTAGTVVMIDPEKIDHVIPSDKAYNTLVAGVVTEMPGIILGIASDGKAMIAHSGRVKVKVDTTYGAISTGDLLVASPQTGYAMRSEPIDIGGTKIHRPGTIIGKALEPLKEGQSGEILVLITLQ